MQPRLEQEPLVEAEPVEPVEQVVEQVVAVVEQVVVAVVVEATVAGGAP